MDRAAAQHGVEPIAIFGLVVPKDIAGLRVDGEGAGVVGAEIEDAVAEERRRFEAAELAAGGHRPHGRELRGVFRSDFRQRAIAPVAVVAAVSQPLLGIVLRLEEIVGSHRIGACGPGRRDHRQNGHHQHAFHDFSLPALSMKLSADPLRHQDGRILRTVKTARQARDIFPTRERQSGSESRTCGVKIRGAGDGRGRLKKLSMCNGTIRRRRRLLPARVSNSSPPAQERVLPRGRALRGAFFNTPATGARL